MRAVSCLPADVTAAGFARHQALTHVVCSADFKERNFASFNISDLTAGVHPGNGAVLGGVGDGAHCHPMTVTSGCGRIDAPLPRALKQCSRNAELGQMRP